MTGWFRFWFVFSAFGPLYLIVWIKLWLAQGTWSSGSIAIFVVSILSVLATIYISRRLATDFGTRTPIKDVHPVDSEVFPYLMTYIPIFLENDVTSASFLFPVAVLYAIIFILFLRLDTPYLHPYFALFGFRVYEAHHAKNGEPMIIIARGRRLCSSDEPVLHEVGTGDVYYCDMRNGGEADGGTETAT